MQKIVFIFGLIVFFYSGCSESLSSVEYNKQIVVTALLNAGQNIDTVKLQWTGEVDKFYNPSDYVIRNAIVKISGVGFQFEDSLRYDPINPGRYYSTDSTKKILPTKTYSLYIQTSDGKVVTGKTTVPDTFSIISSTVKNNDTIFYNVFASPNVIYWSASKYQGTYLPTISSLDSNAAMIPKFFIRDTVNNPKPKKIDYREGMPKEQTYTELPWIFLNYFGTTKLDVYAVDENYGKFLNQFLAGQGGELREIRYNLIGGIGVFGSKTIAKNSITIYLKPL